MHSKVQNSVYFAMILIFVLIEEKGDTDTDTDTYHFLKSRYPYWYNTLQFMNFDTDTAIRYS